VSTPRSSSRASRDRDCGATPGRRRPISRWSAPYNSFLAEEYCATDPRDCFGIGVIPQSGIEDALAELPVLQAGGAAWRAAQTASRTGAASRSQQTTSSGSLSLELGMPLTAHVEINQRRRHLAPRVPRREARCPRPHPRQCPVRRADDKDGPPGGVSALQLVLSGRLRPLPRARVLLRGDPDRLDPTLPRGRRTALRPAQRLGTRSSSDGSPQGRTPSDYIRRHFLWGFQQDRTGMVMRHTSASPSFVWGSDFPTRSGLAALDGGAGDQLRRRS